MRIITIGREYGSGGRQLGKLLAEKLNIPCYDKEVIREIAKLQGVSEERIRKITTTDIRGMYSATVGRSFSAQFMYDKKAMDVFSSQETVLKSLAEKGDCVIVGRSADIILREYKPLNIFVFADKKTKLERCKQRSNAGLTDKQLLKKMKKIDRDRKVNRRVIADGDWGKKENYHLLVNTSNVEIPSIVDGLAEFAKGWFSKHGQE